MKTRKEIISRILADLKSCWIALLILICYFILTQSLFHTVCPFAILSGLPCPGCGLTRSGFALLSGDFISAWNTNPTIYLWVPLILYGILFRYLLGKKPPAYLVCVGIVSVITITWFIWGLLTGHMVEVPCEGLFTPYLGFLRQIT